MHDTTATLMLRTAQVGVGYSVNGSSMEGTVPASIEDLEAVQVRGWVLAPRGIERVCVCVCLVHCTLHCIAPILHCVCIALSTAPSAAPSIALHPCCTLPSTLHCTVAQPQVQYETLPGWLSDIGSVRRWEDLPATARQYVERVEELVGVPIRWIGVGPGRDAIVVKPAAA